MKMHIQDEPKSLLPYRSSSGLYPLGGSGITPTAQSIVAIPIAIPGNHDDKDEKTIVNPLYATSRIPIDRDAPITHQHAEAEPLFLFPPL